MPPRYATTITISTRINAPIEKVFDLSRSIDIHLESTRQTGEEAVGGRTSGLMEPGETVTWRATHFGIRQRLTSKITEYNRPYYFTDEMVKGAFKSFRHQHLFDRISDQTTMRDEFAFVAPFGLAGYLFSKLVLKRYMTILLTKRNAVIKQVAERSC